MASGDLDLCLFEMKIMAHGLLLSWGTFSPILISCLFVVQSGARAEQTGETGENNAA